MSNSKELDTADEVIRAIHNAKLQLEHMVDLAPQVMLLVNRKGEIIRANLAFLKLIGSSDFKIIIGQDISAFLNFKDNSFKDAILSVDNYGLHEMETVIKDKGELVLSYTVVGVQNQKDLLVLIIEDITPRKEREIEEKKSTVKELVGALMHSINQRLTVINMRSKLLLMAMDAGGVFNTEEHRGSLYNIMDISMEIAEILDDLENTNSNFDTKEYMKGIDILDLDNIKKMREKSNS